MKSEKFVKSILESFEFNIEKINETNKQTPDYYVYKNDESYIIEVKEKVDTPFNQNLMKNAPLGKIENISIPLLESNSIRKIISKAKNQINTETEDKDVFRIVWFVCSGVHHTAEEEIIFQSLYGSVPMWDLDNKKWIETTPICYFYNSHNKFYKYRNDLDAVIIGNYENGKLAFNPYSPRYKELKNSSLVKVFMNGVIDPLEEEKNGNAIILDNNVDRTNIAEVLESLKNKYGVRFKPFPMNYHSGFIKVK